MSKLTKLKEWVGLYEAAKHLSGVISEDVDIADIVEIALSKKCVMSVYFGEEVVGRHAPISRYSKDGSSEFLEEQPNSDDCFIGGGVWDLTFKGTEKQNLKNYLTEVKLLGAPELVPHKNGIVLVNNTHYCQLLEPYHANPAFYGSDAYLKSEGLNGVRGEFMPRVEQDVLIEKFQEYLNSLYRIEIFDTIYVPRFMFPEYSEFCLRVSELEKLEEALNGSGTTEVTSKVELSSKERNTLLTLLAVMMKRAGFDYSQRGIATAIEAATEEMGVRVSDDTIRNVIKQFPEALESRQK